MPQTPLRLKLLPLLTIQQNKEGSRGNTMHDKIAPKIKESHDSKTFYKKSHSTPSTCQALWP